MVIPREPVGLYRSRATLYIKRTEEKLESHSRRTGFQVGHSVPDVNQSTVTELVLELLDYNCFAVITTGRLLFIKASIFTCSVL